jgi:hypothetical protein
VVWFGFDDGEPHYRLAVGARASNDFAFQNFYFLFQENHNGGDNRLYEGQDLSEDNNRRNHNGAYKKPDWYNAVWYPITSD